MSSIAAIAVRVLLILFGAVVLGLSVTLAKQQGYGHPPSETAFGSFVGAFSIIVSAIGLASLWINQIPTVGIMAVDALAALFNLAGGIALTIAMKSVSNCTSDGSEDTVARAQNKILNGGCYDSPYCTVSPGNTPDEVIATLKSRCQRAQADYVFEYIGFIFGLGIIVVGYLIHRRGGASVGATYV